MTDRELIEAAARAACMRVVEPFKGDVDDWMWWEAKQCLNCRTSRGESKCWDPLNDDGDALRLGVMLGMEIYVDNHPNGCTCVEVVVVRPGWRAEDRCIETIDGRDPCAATRRAIVRAAAQMVA